MTRKEKQIIIKQVQIAKEISERYLQEWLKTDYTNTKERERKWNSRNKWVSIAGVLEMTADKLGIDI